MVSRHRSSSLSHTTYFVALLCASFFGVCAIHDRRSEEFFLDWSRPVTETKASASSAESLGKILVLLSVQ